MQVLGTNEIRALEGCWSRKLVWDSEENDIRDSDDRSSGCGILVKKEREYGISTPEPPSPPRFQILEYTCQSLLITLSYFPQKKVR